MDDRDDGAPGDPAADHGAVEADARLVRSVRWRLVAWSGGSTLLILLVIAVVLYAGVAGSLEAAGVRTLEARASNLRLAAGGPSEGQTGFAFGGSGSGTFALVVGPNDRLVGRRVIEVPDGLPDPNGVAAARLTGRDVRTTTVAGVPVRILSERVQSRVGDLVVQIVGDRTAEQRTLDVVLAVLVVGGLVALIVSAGFGAAYARRALVPIRDSLAAQRAALRRQRRFAADASHELRTPLTVIRGSVDHLRRHADEPVSAVGDALDDIGAEVDQLTALVDDLLVLARSDSGVISLARLPLDLGDVAAEAASSFAAPAEARGVSVIVDPEPAIVVGDPGRLRQLVGILVDNAIRHSPAGRVVRVTVRATRASGPGAGGPGASLVVEDDGPGIRPADLPHVFDRFWRAPDAPDGGTGLGLAIAAWIVEAHGGRIAAANRPGGGARFSVVIPGSGATMPSVS